MNKRITASLACLVSSSFLVGCSSDQALKRAESGFDYLKEKEEAPLVVPAGLIAPYYDPEFEIPPLGEKANREYLGEKVDIRSPALVLPITRGSRVEESADAVTVWIDAVHKRDVYEPLVWDLIRRYLESEAISVERFAPEKGELETGWVMHSLDEEDGEVFAFRQKYLYQMLFKPYGNSFGLSVKLVAHETQRVKDTWHKGIDSVDQRRYSVQALNKLIYFYDSHRDEFEQSAAKESSEQLSPRESFSQLLMTENGHKLTPRIKVTADFDKEPPRILLAADFIKIGPALRQALLTMGFEITEVIAIDGYVKLKYQPDSDIKLPDGLEPLPLASGSYQLMVGDLKGKTSLLFSDQEGVNLPQWQVDALYHHLVPLMDSGEYLASDEDVSN